MLPKEENITGDCLCVNRVCVAYTTPFDSFVQIFFFISIFEIKYTLDIFVALFCPLLEMQKLCSCCCCYCSCKIHFVFVYCSCVHS